MAGTSTGLVFLALFIYQMGFEHNVSAYMKERHQQRLTEFSQRLASSYWRNERWQLPHRPERSTEAPRFPPKLVLLDADQRVIRGPRPPPDNLQLHPIKHHGELIGWLGFSPREDHPMRDILDQQLREQHWRTLLISSLSALVVALLASWWLARYLVTPITAIAAFAKQLGTQSPEAKLPVTRRDELGDLAREMQQLARTLSAASKARDRWLADISHELRTPLTILQGEIEALLDGIREPDSARLQALHHEVRHLHHLVEDLHTLALADAGTLHYDMAELDLSTLLQEQLSLNEARFQKQQISLRTHIIPSLSIRGDKTRLRQVFSNVLDNSLRYTNAGGECVLTTRRHPGIIEIEISDTAPGVSDADLPYLFEYLYRGEKNSRNRAMGGSGLGLALCRRIIEAHQGSIHAMHTAAGGLSIMIQLPERP